MSDKNSVATPVAPLEDNFFVVIQEGGSSNELYVHALDSQSDADAYRKSCRDEGSYRTAATVEVPDSLVNLSEFFEVFEALVRGYGSSAEVDEGAQAFVRRYLASHAAEVPESLSNHPNFFDVAQALIAGSVNLSYGEDD